MYAKAFGGLARNASLRTLPRPIPKAPLRTQQPSKILQRFQSNQPRGPFPGRPHKVKYTRFDPSQVQHARPLFDSDRFFHKLKHRNTKWLLVLGVSGGGCYYVTHIEEVPVSGRKRFMCFSEESVEKEAGLSYQRIMDDARRQGSVLPEWDARSRMVKRVMDRLIAAGNLEHVNFEVNVLDSPDLNAFVIPGGKVFVYTGILKVAQTDDGLAAVLGHEIAHNLARHAAERMSSTVFLEPLRWAFILADAAIGGNGQIGRILGDLALGLGIERPASRVQESEADYIGLLLMANGCYNPEAAVKMWQRMEEAQKASGQSIPEWFSTHPSNTNRIKKLQEWLPKAEEARAESGCATTIQYQQDFQNVMKSLWH